MIVVVSQAWTKDEDAAADGYLAGLVKFLEFHRQEPGFRGRRVLRGKEDRTHFTNMRFFDSVESYEALTQREGYQDHIMGLYEFLKPYDAYPREFLDVVLSDDMDEPLTP